MKKAKARFGKHEIEFWRFDPSLRDFPAGFKATTTSRGAQAVVPRADGIHWTMQPFDVAVRQSPSSEWVAMPLPAFEALFEEVPNE